MPTNDDVRDKPKPDRARLAEAINKGIADTKNAEARREESLGSAFRQVGNLAAGPTKLAGAPLAKAAGGVAAPYDTLTQGAVKAGKAMAARWALIPMAELGEAAVRMGKHIYSPLTGLPSPYKTLDDMVTDTTTAVLNIGAPAAGKAMTKGAITGNIDNTITPIFGTRGTYSKENAFKAGKAAGQSKEQLWADTGLWEYRNKRYVQEFDDSKLDWKKYSKEDGPSAFDSEAELLLENDGEFSGRISEYITDNPLFEAYPELRGVRLEVRRPQDGDEIGATWWNDSNTIEVVADDMKDARLSVIHELQHAVQDIDDLPRGGSVDDPNYWELGGEVLARNAEHRANYDATHRKLHHPENTQSIDTADQIDRYTGDAPNSGPPVDRIKELLYKNAQERDLGGTKAFAIWEYKNANPDAPSSEVAEALGMSVDYVKKETAWIRQRLTANKLGEFAPQPSPHARKLMKSDEGIPPEDDVLYDNASAIGVKEPEGFTTPKELNPDGTRKLPANDNKPITEESMGAAPDYESPSFADDVDPFDTHIKSLESRISEEMKLPIPNLAKIAHYRKGIKEMEKAKADFDTQWAQDPPPFEGELDRSLIGTEEFEAAVEPVISQYMGVVYSREELPLAVARFQKEGVKQSDLFHVVDILEQEGPKGVRAMVNIFEKADNLTKVDKALLRFARDLLRLDFSDFE